MSDYHRIGHLRKLAAPIVVAGRLVVDPQASPRFSGISTAYCNNNILYFQDIVIISAREERQQNKPCTRFRERDKEHAAPALSSTPQSAENRALFCASAICKTAGCHVLRQGAQPRSEEARKNRLFAQKRAQSVCARERLWDQNRARVCRLTGPVTSGFVKRRVPTNATRRVFGMVIRGGSISLPR